jgi:hypothetical protein
MMCKESYWFHATTTWFWFSMFLNVDFMLLGEWSEALIRNIHVLDVAADFNPPSIHGMDPNGVL